MKKSLLGVVALLIVAAIFWSNIDSKNEEKKKILSESAEKTDKKQPMVKIPSLPSKLNSQPIYIKYQQCKPLLDAITKNQNQWRNNIDSFLIGYLENYNSVNIISALVLLEGGFFAYRKREILRMPDQNLLARQKKTNSMFLEAVGMEMPQGMSISLGVKNLQSYFELSEEERKSNILKIGLVVDNVVAVIRSNDFSNQQIIELMSLLVDINGFTHDSANYRPDNLLDAIVDVKNEALFDAYIRLGGKIETNNFGVNPLERLISNYNLKDGPLPQGLINKLVEYRLPIRVNRSADPKENSIDLGAFWKHRVRDVEYFKELVLSQNLIVTDAPKKDSLSEMPAVKEILGKLQKDKLTSRIPQLSEISQQDIEICQTTRKSVYQSTNHAAGQAKINEAKEIFGDEQSAVVGYLNEIEPSLVDCYLASKNRFQRTVPNSSNEFANIYRKITKGDIYQGIQEFNSVKRDDNQKAYLFWQLVATSPEFAGPLVESGIIPQRNDFFWAAHSLDGKSYSAIEKLGFTFDHKSPDGKSLTEYAAKKCNAELITELYLLQQPYTHETMGRDALSIALTTSSCRNEKARLAVISAVMNFKPIVKKSHQQDIADLRLKDYNSYKSVVDAYPQLEIADDVNIRQYSCSAM
jgi:hypothetical protein